MVCVLEPSRKVLLAVALMLSWWGVQTTAASRATSQDADVNGDQAEHSPQELLKRLAEQLSTIDSLYCEYQIEFVEKNSTLTKSAKSRFARSGKKWFVAEQVDNGPVESRTLYDGDTVFSYRVEVLPIGERLDNGTVQMGPDRELPLLTPDAFLGTDLSCLRRSVVNVFRLADVELSRKKVEDGTNCYRLVAREVGSNGRDQRREEAKVKLRYTIDLLLDPSHEMLPREMLITENENTVTWPGWKQHVKVLDYRQVIDERPNKVRWFPFSAVLEQASPAPDIKFTVATLRINSELPHSLFELQLPDGTQWLDTRIHGPGSKIPTKGKRNR